MGVAWSRGMGVAAAVSFLFLKTKLHQNWTRIEKVSSRYGQWGLNCQLWQFKDTVRHGFERGEQFSRSPKTHQKWFLEHRSKVYQNKYSILAQNDPHFPYLSWSRFLITDLLNWGTKLAKTVNLWSNVMKVRKIY